MKFRYSWLVVLPLIFALVLPVSAAPTLSAQSAILIEAESGTVVFEKNASDRRLIASTTKIMTALCAIESCNLEEEVRVPTEAVGIEGSSIYLKAGEVLTVRDLLYGLMLASANDAATALAILSAGSVEAFAEKMNAKAAELGLENTHFTNPHGLDDEEHYSSAEDLAHLARYALQNATFREIASTKRKTIPLSGDEGTRVLVNHNRMLSSYDGAIGVKTGFTKKSGRCLVSAAERDDVTMIAVTLSAPDDWRDHTALLDYGFSLYESRTLAREGEITATLPCLFASDKTVTATNREELRLILPKDADEITYRIEAIRPCAPVSEGDIIAHARFYCGSDCIASLPLFAAESVTVEKPKTLGEKIADLFR